MTRCFLQKKISILAITTVCSSFCGASFAATETWADLNNQVIELYQKKYYTKAIPVAKKALSLAETTYGKQKPETVLSLNNLAMLYKKKKNYAEAEKLYTQALIASEVIAGKDSPDLAVPLNNLAVLYAAQGRSEDSKKLSDRAVRILEAHYGPNHPNVLEAKKRAADLLSRGTQA